MMDFRAEVKLYCIGRCGRFVFLPVKTAAPLVDTEGEYLPEVPAYVCNICHNWFNRETCRLLIGGKK